MEETNKENYSGIVLGYYDYKTISHFLKDFLDENFVIDFIADTIFERDQGVTFEGIDFINDYHGNKNIMKKVLAKYPHIIDEVSNLEKFLENHREGSFSGKVKKGNNEDEKN
jgi:hypothetical protein